MKKPDFSLRLGGFLGDYLPAQRNASANTIMSYSQTFVLWLEHFKRRGLAPHRLTLEHFTADAVVAFLRDLESGRGNGIRTRNQRLAALRSFARYLQAIEPGRAEQWRRITDLRQKRGEDRLWATHLNLDAMRLLLRAPDQSSRWGRRDATLLSFLYDTGIRVQEVIGLTPADLRLEFPAHVNVLGKGRKRRLVPLVPATVRFMEVYLKEWGMTETPDSSRPLFFNHRLERLTRSGIRWIIRKYAARSGAKTKGDDVLPSPHTFRHSKAMHLLWSGASFAEVQSVLGHADVSTTMRYARMDMEQMRNALERPDTISPTGLGAASWKKNPDLLDWLKERCKKAN